MAEFFDRLEPEHRSFVEAQHVFFVGTAAPEGRVNVSPKGMDSLRVIDPSLVRWLNLTGSGNETAAHLRQCDRMTLLFCSFDRQPLILRIYGTARAFHEGDEGWEARVAQFPDHSSTRQVFDLAVEEVQTSCGFAVPFLHFAGERDTLDRLWRQRGPEEVRSYWARRNGRSIDGFPTGIPGGEGS